MKKLIKIGVLFFITMTITTSCKNADDIRKRALAANQPIVKIVEAIKPTNLGTIKKVGVTEFAKAMETGTLVDVRTPKEFVESHLVGAVNINFKKRTFPDYINAIDKSKPVLVYCRSANRSGKAALIMQSLGFKNIIDLDGGFKAWNAASKEVVKTDNSANEKLQELLKKGELKGAAVVGKGHQVDVATFDKLVKEGKVTLVDTRTAKEYASGHIEGAVNVDWKNRHFADNILKITDEKPVAIYCRSGNRATRAMYAMSAIGFKEVYNLEHGIKSWKAAKMPLKTLEVKGDIRKLDATNFNNAVLGGIGQVVDVRTAREYLDFHLANSINIDFRSPDFKGKFEKLDKKTPVLIYCRTGVRSRKALKQLEGMGFKVYNLGKGIKNWREEGFHVEGKNLVAKDSGEEGC